MRKYWESIYSPNYISGYNPFLLKNMNKAIKKLAYAINNRKKIVIYGVSTVDGICSISSLSLLLNYLNADTEYLIHENKEGANTITEQDIREEVDFLGADLLITLGLDFESKEVLDLCRNLNIDVMVFETRKTDAEPDYDYVNPNQKGCQYRFKNISLSILTFKLMQAVAIYYNMKSINKYLDLILLGTKCERVEEKGENLVILKEGKKYLSNTNNIGICAIVDLAGKKNINEEYIIGQITPSDNTVGVVNNAKIIVELLTTNDRDRAEQIVKYLYK